MTAAVVALAIALVGALAALVAIGHRLLKATDALSDEREVRWLANLERDEARTTLAARAAELSIATGRILTLESSLATARKDLVNARIKAVVDAEPGDVGAAVDRVLAERLAEQTIRVAEASRGHAAPVTVPGSGATAAGAKPAGIPGR